MNINGILIAAGTSGRAKALKPLFVFDCLPFIVVIIRKMLHICGKVYVVLGFEKKKIEDKLNEFLDNEERLRIFIVYNDDYDKGMFSSLKTGLKSATDSDWILYHFVDQPSLPLNFYIELKNKIRTGNKFIQPVFENKPGHPVLIEKDLFHLILNASDAASLRQVVKENNIEKIFYETDIQQVLQDIDTPDDYYNLLGNLGI